MQNKLCDVASTIHRSLGAGANSPFREHLIRQWRIGCRRRRRITGSMQGHIGELLPGCAGPCWGVAAELCRAILGGRYRVVQGHFGLMLPSSGLHGWLPTRPR